MDSHGHAMVIVESREATNTLMNSSGLNKENCTMRSCNLTVKSALLLGLFMRAWSIVAQLPNPVAYYPLDGDAMDQSGNGLNGTINGAVPTLDRCGNANSAFLFNGFSSSITIDFNSLFDIPPTGQLTLSSWIRPNTSSVNAIFVKCFLAVPYTNGQWDYGQYVINFQAMAGAGIPGWILLSDSTIPIDQCWTHYVFTYNNGNWKMYLNGVLVDEDLTQSSFITQSTGGLAIGKKGDSNGDFFNGSIDDVAFYNVELSANQVQNLFDSQKVTFQPVDNNLTICSGESIPLELTGSCATFEASTIQWTPSATLNAGDILNPMASPVVTTSYQSLLTIQQCPFQNTINVNVTNFDVNLGPDATYCSDTTLQLIAQNADANYLWHDGSSDQTFDVSSSGIFWVDVTLDGCTERDSITINMLADIPLNLGNDASICADDTILLDANITGYDLVWQDGSTNSEYLVSTAGTYWVTANSNECSYTDSVTITIDPDPILSIAGDNEICEGQTIELVASGANTYIWSNGQTTPFATISSEGTYQVNGTNTQTGCSGEATFSVTQSPLPEITLPESAIKCEGSSIVALAETSVSGTFLWNTGIEGPSISIDEPGTYSVVLSTVCGESTATIDVSDKPCTNNLFIPNAFTPNEDGINDLFQASSQNLMALEMRVYNRYGELVFFTDDILKGWNGSMMNGDYYCQDGVYTVLYKAQFFGAEMRRASDMWY
jgi:gliding motility-associated-like protein